jgi:hypothetical protein
MAGGPLNQLRIALTTPSFADMADKKKSAWTIIITGIVMASVFFLLNGLFASMHPRLPGMLSTGITFGNAIACWGCIRLAVAKGYPWYVGLLGLISCVGLVVVGFVLKDKDPAARAG